MPLVSFGPLFDSWPKHPNNFMKHLKIIYEDLYLFSSNFGDRKIDRKNDRKKDSEIDRNIQSVRKLKKYIFPKRLYDGLHT